MSAMKQLLRWSPTSAGRIKIGMNKTANNKMGKLPTKIEGFLITKDRKDNENLNFIVDNQAHKILKSVDENGAIKPIFRIPIEFDSDNIENFLFVRRASYEGKTCVCSLTDEYPVDINGEVKDCNTCPKNNPNYNGYDKCKVNASLYVKIVGVTPLGKYHVFKTTGWNSFQALGNSILSLWKEGIGRVRGPVYHLTYGEKTVIDAKGQTRKVPIISVEFDGTKDDLHSKIIETANKEAKYMSDMTAINGFKLNHSQDLFIDFNDVEEFYPEAQALPEPKINNIGTQNAVESEEFESEEFESVEIEETVSEPTENVNPTREDLVKLLCQDLGWTEELLKGKRINTLKGYLDDGVMPPMETVEESIEQKATEEVTEEITEQPTEQPTHESIVDNNDIPDFTPKDDNDDDEWGEI